MPTQTVRDIPEDNHRRLTELAALHGRSAAAEARVILATAVKA
jgi:plasmid stability protein